MRKYNAKKWIILLISIYFLCSHALSHDDLLNHEIPLKASSNNAVTHVNNYNLPTRDPFSPPTSTHCMIQVKAFRQWALGGITSNQGSRYGWVVRPDGIWQQVKEGEYLPGNWQVTHIHARQRDLLQVSPTGNHCVVFIQSAL